MSTVEGQAREAWKRFETIHGIVYFTPELRRQGDALGLRGFWMAYFACRIAPLGALGAAATTAVFYNFHPRRVGRALPHAWGVVTPEQALSVRLVAATDSLRGALAQASSTSIDVARAADLAWEAAQLADIAGRPLAAANQAMDRPEDPLQALWQATSVLREHRGDGHNAVLIAHDVGPAQAHLIKTAAGESEGATLKTGRDFDDAEWAEAGESLVARGWLTRDGRLTDAGLAEHRAIEHETDRAAAEPWRRIGEEATRETIEAMQPIARAVLETGIIPVPSPVGLLWND